MLNLNIQNKLNEVKKSCLVFDVETTSHYEDGREINIRTSFEDYVANAKVVWFGAYSYKYDKQYYLNARTDTQQIVNLLKEHTVLIGANSEDFDFPICKNNGLTNDFNRYIQVDIMQILGTANQRNRNGYAYKNRAALMDYKLKSNSLRCMAETLGVETQKGDIDYKIFAKESWTQEETNEIIKYLSSDVMATKQLFDKLWYYWLPFAELLDEKNVYDLSWIRSSIASLTYKAACRVLNTEPTYSDKQSHTEEMGGNVYEPTVEEANGVWYVDVGSLYPHIISMFNLPAEIDKIETDIIINEMIKRGEKIWHGNELFKVKGYYDVSSWHPIASYIADKLKERISLKEKEPNNPMVYTLKILLNGLYGIFRSATFEKIHTPNVGYDTCYLGQQIQSLIKELMEQFGFDAVYGDTDSVMFKARDEQNNNREYVVECLTQVVDIIKDNVPFPVDTFKINIEHYLEYLMFPFEFQAVIDEETGKNKKEGKKLVKERQAKKKNYLFTYTENNERKVVLKGFPIKKDNATELGIKLYHEVLEPLIIRDNRAKFSKEFLQSTVASYLERPEIMQLMSIEYKVNEASSYKKESQIQAQISVGYLNGQGGVIRLIKNNKVGNVGKGSKYCSVQEAIENKLTPNDLDLDKLWEELSPFVEYVQEPEVVKKPRKKKQPLDKTN